MSHFCRQWRLKPSASKTISSVFHLHTVSQTSKTGVHLDGYNSMLQRRRSSEIWMGTRQRLQQLVAVVIRPLDVVRDLGVFIDDELTFKQHVAWLVSSCFSQLRRLRQVIRRVSHPVLKQLIHSLVVSRQPSVCVTGCLSNIGYNTSSACWCTPSQLSDARLISVN